MKNFLQDDEIIEVTAPAGGVTSGDGVLIGNLFGIAFTTEAAGAKVNLQTEGVFALPKLSTDTITQGQRVYWDANEAEVTETATGNYLIGVAIQAAGNGVVTVPVRLDGVSTAAAS